MCPIHICGIPADRILSRGYSREPTFPAGTTAISEFTVAVVTILVAISLHIACPETTTFVTAPTAFIEVACIFTVFVDFAGSIIIAISF